MFNILDAKKIFLALAFLVVVGLVVVTQGEKADSNLKEDTNAPVSGLATSSITSKSLVGNWRSYPQRLYFDAGGSLKVDTPSSRKLELKANGKWVFGSSSGTWKLANIEAKDWTKWGIEPYGPKKKIVLNNWNKKIAYGPIEESSIKGQVDFIWVIYRVDPPVVSRPGIMHAKFGH